MRCLFFASILFVAQLSSAGQTESAEFEVSANTLECKRPLSGCVVAYETTQPLTLEWENDENGFGFDIASVEVTLAEVRFSVVFSVIRAETEGVVSYESQIIFHRKEDGESTSSAVSGLPDIKSYPTFWLMGPEFQKNGLYYMPQVYIRPKP